MKFASGAFFFPERRSESAHAKHVPFWSATAEA